MKQRRPPAQTGRSRSELSSKPETHTEREENIRIKYFAIKSEQEEEVEGFTVSRVTRK